MSLPTMYCCRICGLPTFAENARCERHDSCMSGATLLSLGHRGAAVYSAEKRADFMNEPYCTRPIHVMTPEERAAPIITREPFAAPGWGWPILTKRTRRVTYKTTKGRKS